MRKRLARLLLCPRGMQRIGRWLFYLSAVTVAVACDADLSPDPDVPAYLGDSATRRQLLEAALWRPDLPYSRELLDSYGLGTSGWDLLPKQAAKVRPFTTYDADALARGDRLVAGALHALESDTPPDRPTAWRALGQRVFAEWPLRTDAYLTWLAANPARWNEFGVAPRADGTVRGLVVYTDQGVPPSVGVTCAFCHGGDDVMGRGDRRLDVGAVRAAHALAIGRDASDLNAWGPGRADVTDDGVPSVTAIPDLWGLSHATYLNHSGVIAVDSPSTLALRFETQYIKGHRMRRRPPRSLMWALAQFLTTLTPPQTGGPFKASNAAPELIAAGGDQFQQRCAGCHDPARGYSGDLVAAGALAVDAAVATTPERGTGFYKVPSLTAVRANAPYLHDGSAPTLHSLLAAGHPFGTAADPSQRNALIAFLNTL